MKGIGRSVAVAACGLFTSAVTALLVTKLSESWHLDIYTLSVWVAIPLGAIGTGFVAASGYYVGGLLFNRRPDLSLLLQVLLIAGFTQWLIYRLGYAHAHFSDGTAVSSAISFKEYLALTLSQAHLVMGRYASLRADSGALGSAGYGFAALYFIGFLLGGAILWAKLRGKPYCGDCGLYLARTARRERRFTDPREAAAHYRGLFMHKMGTPDFAQALCAEPSPGLPLRGALNVITLLHSCPECRAQMIEQQVTAYDGRHWRPSEELHRHINVPTGVNLTRAFNPPPARREPQPA